MRIFVFFFLIVFAENCLNINPLFDTCKLQISIKFHAGLIWSYFNSHVCSCILHAFLLIFYKKALRFRFWTGPKRFLMVPVRFLIFGTGGTTKSITNQVYGLLYPLPPTQIQYPPTQKREGKHTYPYVYDASVCNVRSYKRSLCIYIINKIPRVVRVALSLYPISHYSDYVLHMYDLLSWAQKNAVLQLL